MEKKILAGVTPDGDLYFLNITRENQNGQFSMTGETVRPIRREDAEQQTRESLEDGELWKMAVESDSTTLGLDEWVDFVLATDGELSGFDNSLFDAEIEVNGEDWLFESSSCGQHQEKELAHYFIDKFLFDNLMRLWDTYHLKQAPTEGRDLGILDGALLIEQDIEAEAKRAVELIND